jgi:hypothetical protein
MTSILLEAEVAHRRATLQSEAARARLIPAARRSTRGVFAARARVRRTNPHPVSHHASAFEAAVTAGPL